jgi:hypothetical protein
VDLSQYEASGWNCLSMRLVGKIVSTAGEPQLTRLYFTGIRGGVDAVPFTIEYECCKWILVLLRQERKMSLQLVGL